MKTLLINISGNIIKSKEDIVVVGGVKDGLFNKCCYELGKVLVKGSPELSGIAKQKLVTDFRDYAPDAYMLISRQLELVKYKVLSEQPTGTMKVELPSEYLDWLFVSFRGIAEQLERQGNVVEISIDSIYRRLLAESIATGSLGCRQLVVNDNAVTDDSALVHSIQDSIAIKENVSIAFVPYEEWEEVDEQELYSAVSEGSKSTSDDIISGNVSFYDSKERLNSGAKFVSGVLKSVQEVAKSIVQDSKQPFKQLVEIVDESASDMKALVDEECFKSCGFSLINHGNGNQLFVINSIEFLMVKVEGGPFKMGGTEEQGHDASSLERPIRDVSVSDLYMSETVVTQELWTEIMGSNHSKLLGKKRPVTNVSYDDCMAFLQRLNTITGKSFRLPTEEEWEYAARGGQRRSNYKYSGSNSIEDVAWYSPNANKVTHDVKTKNPNALDLYDMSGNVWEWCATPFRQDKDGQQSTQMITRGGCATSTPNACRTSRRYYCETNHRSCYLGFRLVY